MLESTKLEKSAAEEERGHAHEQVLSLIRECNALEEQIHRLSKDKCRLQEQVSSLENDLRKVRDHAQEAKDQLAMKVEQLVAIEKQLKEIKVSHILKFSLKFWLLAQVVIGHNIGGERSQHRW
nr:uncharacterized protein LOC128694091 [Cherax quadricarinatus]